MTLVLWVTATTLLSIELTYVKVRAGDERHEWIVDCADEVRGNNRRLVGRLAQTGAACKPGSGLGFTRVQGILHIGFGLDLARLLGDGIGNVGALAQMPGCNRSWPPPCRPFAAANVVALQGSPPAVAAVRPMPRPRTIPAAKAAAVDEVLTLVSVICH